MSVRAVAIALAGSVLAPALASALPLVAPPPSDAIVLAAAASDPVGAHAAIAQAEERLTEMDATISVLQEEADKAEGAARQRAHDAVAALRTIRDTYRKDIDGVVAQGKQMTSDQLAAARAALTAPWTQFDQAVDRDVAALKLGAERRKALVEARIRAEQAYLQSVMTDLQAAASALTAEQRAAIDARVAKVKAQVEAAQARLTRLDHAGRSAWSTLKQGFVNSRQIFEDSYRDAR